MLKRWLGAGSLDSFLEDETIINITKLMVITGSKESFSPPPDLWGREDHRYEDIKTGTRNFQKASGW